MPFFGTFSEAQAAKREQKVNAVQAQGAWRELRHQQPHDGDLLVVDYFARWLRQSEKRLAPHTVASRARAYRNHLHEAFGATAIRDVGAQMIEDWMHERLGGGGNFWTTRTAFHTLQAMLGEAAKKRHVEWNPCMAVDFPKPPERTRRDHLLVEEYQAVVAACQSPVERRWIGLAGEAGLRRGEICGLKVSALDLDADDGPEMLVSVNIVRVKKLGLIERPPKGGNTRIVSLTPTLAVLLREHIETTGISGEDYLFASPSDGGAIKPDYLSETVPKIIVRAGLHDAKGKALFHLHDLRRTAATLARERGVDVGVIRDQLGHGHERMTTRHYIRARTNPNLGTFAAVMDGIAQPAAG